MNTETITSYDVNKIVFTLLPEPAQTIMRKEYPTVNEIVYSTHPADEYVTHDSWELEQLIATVDPQIDSYLLSNPTTTATVIKRIQNSPHNTEKHLMLFKALKHPNCDIDVVERVIRADLRLGLTNAPALVPEETWNEWVNKIKAKPEYAPVLANPNLPSHVLNYWVNNDNSYSVESREDTFLAQNIALTADEIKKIATRANSKDWLLSYTHSLPLSLLMEWLNEAFNAKKGSVLRPILENPRATEQTLNKIILWFQYTNYPNKTSHMTLLNRTYPTTLDIPKPSKLKLLKLYYPELTNDTPVEWLNELFASMPDEFWAVELDGFTELVDNDPGRVVGF